MQKRVMRWTNAAPVVQTSTRTSKVASPVKLKKLSVIYEKITEAEKQLTELPTPPVTASYYLMTLRKCSRSRK